VVVEVFEGNVADPSPLSGQVERLEQRFTTWSRHLRWIDRSTVRHDRFATASAVEAAAVPTQRRFGFEDDHSSE
jgi:hypothetical protein